jgi:hypothetical protein
LPTPLEPIRPRRERYWNGDENLDWLVIEGTFPHEVERCIAPSKPIRE